MRAESTTNVRTLIIPPRIERRIRSRIPDPRSLTPDPDPAGADYIRTVRFRYAHRMAVIVHTYGGSSVSDVQKLRHVAERVMRTRQEGYDVVVVVSAMGDTT